MSLEIKGRKCAVCQAYLFEDDDIVWCAECGAAHHRDCYKAFGKCGYTDIHGTKQLESILNKEKEHTDSTKAEDTQNRGEKTQVECPYCHTKYESDSKSCPNCSAVNMAGRIPAYMTFDFLGGVKPEEDIGEGVTAQQAKRFVMASTNRIIPKFAAFKKGAKRFFSWWTFFFPAASFASRKMYGAAVLSGIVETAGLLLMFPLSLAVRELGLATYQDIYAYMSAGVSKEFSSLMLLAFIGTGLLLAYKIISGFIFDKVYYKHTISKIKDIEENFEGDEKALAYRKYGGYNIFGFLLTVIILQYVPGIIASFIM